MFKSTPEKDLASWVFMNYFAGTDGQAIYGARTGYFPARCSSQKTGILSRNYAEWPQKGQAFQEVFPAARINQPDRCRKRDRNRRRGQRDGFSRRSEEGTLPS